MQNTSWEKVSDWYSNSVGTQGHYYHQKIILPNLLRLMNLSANSKLLDLGCGQGILARMIPTTVEYLGIDLSPSLIEKAREFDNNKKHSYGVSDITKDLPIRSSGFSHVAIVLALQNVKHPFRVMANAAKHLSKEGKLFIVLNHPSFRIPKHSDWQVNREKTIQSRVVDSYMSKLEIPIESSPHDKKNNQTTWSYHFPLSVYSEMLHDAGFAIEVIEEWVSDKKSEGGMAKVEDKARAEFPLFMAILARRILI